MPVHRIGGYAWLLAAFLYFAPNVVAGKAWQDTNRPREVGALWHAAMNGAMIATGVLLAVGVLLTGRALGRGPATRIAQLLTLAGAGGYVMAGVYPADLNEDRHFLAGLLVFVLGNAGLLVASMANPRSILGDLSGFSRLLGLAGLGGTALFFARIDLGLGVGGIERVAVFPLLIWVVAVGLRLLDRAPARSGGSTELPGWSG